MTSRFSIVYFLIGVKASMLPVQRMILMRVSEDEMEGIYTKVRRMKRGPSWYWSWGMSLAHDLRVCPSEGWFVLELFCYGWHLGLPQQGVCKACHLSEFCQGKCPYAPHLWRLGNGKGACHSWMCSGWYLADGWSIHHRTCQPDQPMSWSGSLRQ